MRLVLRRAYTNSTCALGPVPGSNLKKKKKGLMAYLNGSITLVSFLLLKRSQRSKMLTQCKTVIET